MSSVSSIKKKLDNLVAVINKDISRLNTIFKSADDTRFYLSIDFNITSLLSYLEDLYLCSKIINQFSNYLNMLSNMADDIEKLADRLPGVDDAATVYHKYKNKEKDYAAITKELGSQKLFDKYLKLAELHELIMATDQKIMEFANIFCEEMIELATFLNSENFFSFMEEEFYPTLKNNAELAKFIMPWLMAPSDKEPLSILSESLKCFNNFSKESNNNSNQNLKLRL